MDRKDCIFPDCQITGDWIGLACEHACPFSECEPDRAMPIPRNYVTKDELREEFPDNQQ